MKKLISFLMAALLMFSIVCIGVNADELEQHSEKVDSAADRISFSDDELREKFGIKQILLPENYKLQVYEFFTCEYDWDLPDILHITFIDNTEIDCKLINSNYGNSNVFEHCSASSGQIINPSGESISITAGYTYIFDSEEDLVFEISLLTQNDYKRVFLDCDKLNHSFSSNTEEYKRIVSDCIVGVFAGKLDRVTTGLKAELKYNILDFASDIIQLNVLFIKYLIGSSISVLK
ncbi:MAG: hypothetical protein IJK60_11245 [Clostridia bacterium]|nr:hypothetical protein [Clostridia bacterium]